MESLQRILFGNIEKIEKDDLEKGEEVGIDIVKALDLLESSSKCHHCCTCSKSSSLNSLNSVIKKPIRIRCFQNTML